MVGSGAVVGGMVPAASGQTTTITICEQLKTEYAREIDARKEGFSAGDSFVYANRLLNPQTGKRRGRIVGTVAVVRVFHKQQDAAYIADFTLRLPRGTVSAYGASRFGTRAKKWAIIGGTGAYRQVRVRWLKETLAAEASEAAGTHSI